jgi:hypothetical protein
MCPVRQVFNALLAFNFLSEAVRSLTAEFKGAATPGDGLLAMNCGLLTAYLLQQVSAFRSTRYLTARGREYISDFGPPAVILGVSALSLLPAVQALGTFSRLSMPGGFQVRSAHSCCCRCCCCCCRCHGRRGWRAVALAALAACPVLPPRARRCCACASASCVCVLACVCVYACLCVCMRGCCATCVLCEQLAGGRPLLIPMLMLPLRYRFLAILPAIFLATLFFLDQVHTLTPHLHPHPDS